MSHVGTGYDINQTFIIEPLDNGIPLFSACTALYTNNILSCSGNTQIFLDNGVITFDGNLYTNDNLTANTINASTYYSGGTSLIDIISFNNITGGTFNNTTDTLTLYKQNNSTVVVTGFTDYFTTGATLIGSTVYFDRNDALSAYTLNLSTFSADTYVTGVTFSNNQLIIGRNDGVNLNTFINTFTGLTVNGIFNANSIIANNISATTISASTFYGNGSNLTGISTQDTFVTGGTYNSGTTVFTNNTGGTFSVTGFYTGYTAPIDVFVTGGTYSTGNATFTNNTGGTFSVTGFSTSTGSSFTGGTVSGSTVFTNGLTANTFSATTYQNLPLDIHVTGFTFNNGNYNITINQNDGTSYTQSLSTLASDVTITGGTYNPVTGIATFVNNTGGTFTVTGFLTGYTDTTVSAFTYNNANTFKIDSTNGESFSANINSVTGLTVNGSLSATTYLGLPTDIRVTGGTYSNGSATFTNNTGGTFSVTGFKTSDVFVTGGTYTNGNAIFTNNTGGTFNVSGFSIGGGGGQLFYLNLSQSKNGNRYLSTTASTAAEQSTGVTINNGVTGTIASFQSDVLGITLIPGGVWSFYLHSYKQNSNATFDIFVELYKKTSGGTSTLLFATDPTAVTSNSPNPSMQLTDVYFSGSPVVVTDSVVAVVKATNTNNQPHTITLVSEGLQHYSYAISTLPTQQGLTCDTLSGCSIIQTIQSNLNNKLDKSGGTITNNLVINGDLTATTISASTYLNTPYWISGSTGSYTIKAKNDSSIDATGNYSLAEGSGTTASGIASHSEGGQTTAIGNYSHAEGYVAIAQGSASHAEGAYTTAVGDQSHAEGFYTSAIGYATHTEGGNTIASGPRSHAEGNSTVAIGDSSHAEGYLTQALGYTSHAEGGATTASGMYAHSEGFGTQASGVASHAEGNVTTAIGNSSHAEGEKMSLTSNHFAQGVASHIEGGNTIAYSPYSHAEGTNNLAIGIGTHVEGYNNKAGSPIYTILTFAANQIVLSGDYTGNFANSDVIGLIDSLGEPLLYSLNRQITLFTVMNVSFDGGTLETTIDFDPSLDVYSSNPVYVINLTTYETTLRSAHAEGYSTTASGEASHAEGATTTASGNYSHAEGFGSEATGIYSHAEGNYTIASGDYSHAEGFRTTASGYYSHAEGFRTTTSGDYSHAEGNNTTADGEASHTEGSGTTASGNYSHAEGNNTIASGEASHAEGAETTASGLYSHAEGFQTTATYKYTHAEGCYTISSGGYGSHAEGQNTEASGYASHSEGGNTIAFGSYSHAGGVGSVASGNTSFVHGNNSQALGNGTVVFGTTITGTTDNTVYVPYFNIKYLSGGTSVNNLGIDTDGYVVVGSAGGSSFTGGTVSGPTSFTNGLTANTLSVTTIITPSILVNDSGLRATALSATTYLNLPLDIRVTGGTYSSGTAIFTNNTGGTFSVTGFSTSTSGSFTGGTVSGATVFTNGLSANTFTLTSVPVNDDTTTQILSRDATTGAVEYINYSAITAYNYGLSFAIANAVYLT